MEVLICVPRFSILDVADSIVAGGLGNVLQPGNSLAYRNNGMSIVYLEHLMQILVMSTCHISIANAPFKPPVFLNRSEELL